ncbi:helix-turn-helix domain-containing protein [Rhodobacter capsulatus]|uniref:helix-turn-helix domain-containing protein n=1 Tax=Rhodobacter capsulatus TaxID=1061 RepID=UPI00402948F5
MDVFSNAAQSAPMKKLIAAAVLSPEMHPDRVGERVAAIRQTLNMSKAEFADSLELDRSTMSKVESGTKGLDIIVGARIADFYGFGLDFIYRGVLSDTPPDLRSAVAANLQAVRLKKAKDDAEAKAT